MTTVRQLLETKGHDINCVHPDDMVLDALKLMESKDIGSVLVKEGDELVGIFTERLYARNVFLKGKASPETPVGEIMTKRVICALPEQTVDECMAIMTGKRVRHLPIMDDGRLVGIISIGDLVRSIIADQKFAIEQLEHYIHG